MDEITNDGFTIGVHPSERGYVAWCFEPTSSFYNYVAYEGDGAATRRVKFEKEHNRNGANTS